MAILNKSMRRFMDKPALREELYFRRGEVQKLLDERWHPEDHFSKWAEFYEKPELPFRLIENYNTPNERKIKTILNIVVKPKLWVLIGIKGGGKTAFALWILEEAHKKLGMKVCVFRPVMEVKYLPDYFEIAYEPYEIPENSLTFYDEAQMQLQSREFMKKEHIDFSKFLSIQRHRGFAGIISSQVLQMLDINIIRYADGYFFKKMSRLMTVEHKKDPVEVYLDYMKPITVQECLFIDLNEDEVVLFSNPLPSFWCDELSRPFRVITEGEIPEEIIRLWEHKRRVKDIREILLLKGKDVSTGQIEGIIRKKYKKVKVLKCKKCYSFDFIRYGLTRDGKQKYQCKRCGSIFKENTRRS